MKLFKLSYHRVKKQLLLLFILLWLIFLLLIKTQIFLNYFNTKAEASTSLPSPISDISPIPTEITPTLFCIGSCPIIPSPSPTITGFFPSPTIVNPSVSPTSLVPSSTQNPCAVSQSSISISTVKKHQHTNGTISQFINFLLQLLLDLLKQIFGITIAEPQPAPKPTQAPTAPPITTTTTTVPVSITPAPVSPTFEPTINPCITPSVVPATPNPSSTITGVSPTPISSSFLAVTYMQASHPGPDMWINYDPALVHSDFSKIRALGFNGVRITIPAYTGAFDWPSPTASELAHLEDFYRAAKENGLQLHITMFDLFGGKIGYIDQSRIWATAVITALKSVDPSLSGIYVLETHNEMFSGPTFNTTYTGGYDSGWPANVAKPTDVWGVELVWIQQMTYLFRSLAPGIPVTTSVPSAQNNALTNPIGPGEGLGYYYHYSHGTDWQPTWYDYHLYGAPNNIFSQLSTALATVGGNPQMLHIGEFGYDVDGTTPTTAQRSTAALYEQNARYYAHQLGLPVPQWWMLYDMPAGGTQFPNGQSDGLMTVTGTDTPAGTVYRTYPPATVPPLSP